MKRVHVWRTGDLVDVTGDVRRVQRRRRCLRLVADDGTVTLIPWSVVSRVKVERVK